MQRLQRHDKLRGGAIGVGDDVLAVVTRHVAVEHRGVHFGHDQRHIGVVAPEARVIDHDGAGRADALAPFLGDGRAGRHQGEIDAGEVEVLKVLNLQALVAEGDFLPLRPGGGERNDLGGGKLPLGEDVEHFPANIAGGPDDGDAITHL